MIFEINYNRIVGTSENGTSIFLEAIHEPGTSCGTVELVRWIDGSTKVLGSVPGESLGSAIEADGRIALTSECEAGDRYLTTATLVDDMMLGQTAEVLAFSVLPEIAWTTNGEVATNTEDEFEVPLPNSVSSVKRTPFDHPDGIGLEGGPAIGFVHSDAAGEEIWWSNTDFEDGSSEELNRIYGFCPSIPKFSTDSNVFAVRDAACTDDFTTVIYGELDANGEVIRVESVTFDADFARVTPTGTFVGPDAVSVASDGSVTAWLATGETIDFQMLKLG